MITSILLGVGGADVMFGKGEMLFTAVGCCKGGWESDVTGVVEGEGVGGMDWLLALWGDEHEFAAAAETDVDDMDVLLVTMLLTSELAPEWSIEFTDFSAITNRTLFQRRTS